MPQVKKSHSRSLKFALATTIIGAFLTPTIASAPPFPAVAAGIVGLGAATLGAVPGLAPGLSDALLLKTSNVWLQEVRFKQSTKGKAPAAATGPINGNSPVLVHVIIFYGEQSFQTIGGLNADQYFKNIDQIKRDHRATTQIFEYEISPGVDMPPQYILRTAENGLACGVFARYASPGAHRFNVGSDRIIEIELGPLDFTVNTIKA